MITVHDLTTNYLADVAIPSGASRFEAWGGDAAPAAAHADVWLRLRDQVQAVAGSGGAEILIPAGQTYVIEPGRGNSGWAYSIKAAVGTPKGVVVLV